MAALAGMPWWRGSWSSWWWDPWGQSSSSWQSGQGWSWSTRNDACLSSESWSSWWWASQCWLKQELRGLEKRRIQTEAKVRRARKEVDELDTGEEAGDRVLSHTLSHTMETAVLRLQAAMADQDYQWQRQIMLQTGIFVYDDQGPNAGKRDVELDGEAKSYIRRLFPDHSMERQQVIESYSPPPHSYVSPPPLDAWKLVAESYGYRPPPGVVSPPPLPGHGRSQAASATSPAQVARAPLNEPPTPGPDLQLRGQLPQSSGASYGSRSAPTPFQELSVMPPPLPDPDKMPPPPPPGMPPKRAWQESLPLNGSRNGLAQVVP